MFEQEYIKILNTPREIQIGPYVFDDIEVADNDTAIRKGLMFRQDVPDNFCMLFKFDDDNIRSFWMKNCEFPIVVVFCDKNWKIVSIHRMKVEETCNDEELTRYSSVVPARYAIEFKDSNWFDAVPDIAVGTQVEVKL